MATSNLDHTTKPSKEEPKRGFFTSLATIALSIMFAGTGVLYFRERARNKQLDKKYGKWKNS